MPFEARQGQANEAMLGNVRLGQVRWGKARQFEARRGKSRQSQAMSGETRRGPVRGKCGGTPLWETSKGCSSRGDWASWGESWCSQDLGNLTWNGISPRVSNSARSRPNGSKPCSYSSYSFLTSVVDGYEWPALCPDMLYPLLVLGDWTLDVQSVENLRLY